MCAFLNKICFSAGYWSSRCKLLPSESIRGCGYWSSDTYAVRGKLSISNLFTSFTVQRKQILLMCELILKRIKLQVTGGAYFRDHCLYIANIKSSLSFLEFDIDNYRWIAPHAYHRMNYVQTKLEHISVHSKLKPVAKHIRYKNTLLKKYWRAALNALCPGLRACTY